MTPLDTRPHAVVCRNCRFNRTSTDDALCHECRSVRYRVEVTVPKKPEAGFHAHQAIKSIPGLKGCGSYEAVPLPDGRSVNVSCTVEVSPEFLKASCIGDVLDALEFAVHDLVGPEAMSVGRVL